MPSMRKIDAIWLFNHCLSSMVLTSVFILLVFLLNIQIITSVDNRRTSTFNGLRDNVKINTTSGIVQGSEVFLHGVFIQTYRGIPYGERPIRFQKSTLRRYNNESIIQATKYTPACPQHAGDLSYGPFVLSNMYDEDCLTLDMYIPKIHSLEPKAIMVYCHGGSNQFGSASLFDGSVIAAIGDVIVITINYRLGVFGFLTPDRDTMAGNYGLHDQLLALKWISLNAKYFHGDSQRITYVGHSAGATNAILLAMSKLSEKLITRVIAQSGGPLNQWAIDRQPHVRFNNVMKNNNLKTKKSSIQSNIDFLKSLPSEKFQYNSYHGLDVLPTNPFPIIDNEILSDNIEEMIHIEPFVNVDLLLGVTADESLYFAEGHIFYYHLSQQQRRKILETNAQMSTITNNNDQYSKSSDDTELKISKYLKSRKYIKNYLQANHPEYVCFSEEIESRYSPSKNEPYNASKTIHLYSDLLSDLMFNYDIVRFLHQRLDSKTKAPTYVYYYTYPPIFRLQDAIRYNPTMVGHFAELDLIWGVPFNINKTNNNSMLQYKSNEIEFSRQMILYWTNFIKTGNPNTPNPVSIRWRPYKQMNKSYINLHADNIRMENNFLEEQYQFWTMISYRHKCMPFRWYHTFLLIMILIIALLLISIYIFYNSKRSRRNIQPTELDTSDIITFQFLPTVAS